MNIWDSLFILYVVLYTTYMLYNEQLNMQMFLI